MDQFITASYIGAGQTVQNMPTLTVTSSGTESPSSGIPFIDPSLLANLPSGMGTTQEQAKKEAKKEEEKRVVAFDSVIISDEKREEIKAAISQVDNWHTIFQQWGFAEVFEKGTAVTLLFYGVPGTGKTLMAQAIAEELNADLKTYGTAEIESSEPGGPERKIQQIFEAAKQFFLQGGRRQVILFDECDALLYDRNKVGVILGAQINALLTAIEKHDGIIIFTTNRLGVLDPALERRIAAKIEFPFPNILQRERIWKRMMPKKAPIADDVDFIALAGYPLTGGKIKNAVLNAARMAAYKKAKEIAMQHFTDAVNKELKAQGDFEETHDEYTSSARPEHIHMSETRKLEVVPAKSITAERNKK